MRVLLFAALLATAAGAQTCSPDATRAAAAQTLALQSRLLAAYAPAMNTDVPAGVRPVLHDFKQALIQTIDVALRCNNPEPARLQPDLIALLHANKPEPPQKVYDARVPDPTTGIYGASLHLAAKSVAGQADLYTIQLTYGIECGADNILLVYRHTPQGYQRELVWQNPDLNSIGDAFGDIFYFAPVPAPAPAFVVVYGQPWCSSNFSGFHADLIATSSKAKPQALLDQTQAIYFRDEDTKFVPEPYGFELLASVESSDMDVARRPGIYRYATATGKLILQPVAANAQAFVDSWLHIDPQNTSTWTEPVNAVRLKTIHDTMTGPGADFIQFGPTLACGKSHYQVELRLQADHTTPDRQIIDLPSKYAQVHTNAASFTLLDISDKPDPGCTGPDLMKRAR